MSLIAQVVPIVHLLTKIIECLAELQKSSKKHSAAFAVLTTQMIQIKSMLEAEIEARKKEQALAAAERIFIKGLLYVTTGLACGSAIYIGLHVAGLIR